MAVFTPGASLITEHGRTSQFVAFGFTDTHTIHGDFQNIQAQTAFMLIDISDTTNWTHSGTDHINIEYLILEIDPDTNYLGEIKLGFLTNVDGTNGDFNQIVDIDLVKKSDLVIEIIDFGSHGFHCKTNSHFGPMIVDSALFQTDVNLEGPDGNTSYPSGDGDLVMVVEVSAGAVDVSITLGYETVS